VFTERSRWDATATAPSAARRVSSGSPKGTAPATVLECVGLLEAIETALAVVRAGFKVLVRP
jgi:hypothetical protein